MSKTEEAALEYLARKDRTSHPAGDFDNAKRWYPSKDERQKCCQVRSIKSTSI